MSTPTIARPLPPIAHLTVGGLRDWLLSDASTADILAALAPGITPEMAAAVSKISRLQDLMVMACKCAVVTRFRNTIGLPGRLSVRLQPNHPTDDLAGIAASILDGLLLGAGDAVIGINPATDSPERAHALLAMLEDLRIKLDVPTQSCVLAHVTTTLDLIARGSPVDLVFQSIAGTQAANKSFGIDLALLDEAQAAALSLQPRQRRRQRDVFRDRARQRALRRRASRRRPADPGGARLRGGAPFRPLLINTVVGFIGPEYLYDGKQIIRAGLEDHFCGKLMGLPMGCDVCYTNHAEADQDDMDALLTLLGRRRRQLHHGRARRRRRHAGLSEHLVSRRARHARSARPPPGAGIRSLARAPGMIDTAARIRPRSMPGGFRALLPA